MPSHCHRSAAVRAAILASMITLAAPAASRATPVPALRIDCPQWIVQIGTHVNPEPGLHPLVPDSTLTPFVPGCMWPPRHWAIPVTVTITDDYNFARMEGTCTHLIAVHTDESAPAPTWWYNGGVGFAPPPFGMRAGRIRGAVYHAGATHWDNYLEDIGTFVGTVPGPSVVPMVAFIQGSIGRHPDSGEPVTFCAGADLTPPSGLPSLPDQDYPAGQMIVMVDQTSFIGAMAVAAVGLSRQNVLAASIREGGPVGPIMFDLGPGEMWTDLGGQGIARAYADLPFPPSLVQDMMAGIAYVQITTVAHPDGMIGGHLVAVQEGPSGVGDLPDGDEVLAYSAAPNPFNPATRVAFQLAQASRVRLEIFDASGRRVRVLLDEQMPAGAHTAAWDGAADNGRQQGSGVYFCRIKAGDYVKTIKLALLK